MSRLQLFWLHLTVAVTAITGGVFAVMKYFMKSADEFSVVNHPMQPQALAAHVVVAPLLLFVFGWTFSNHMLPKLRFGDGSKLRSGGASMMLIIPMTLSAYFLQISTGDALRRAMEIAHWISSGLFVLGYLVHMVVKSKPAFPSP